MTDLLTAPETTPALMAERVHALFKTKADRWLRKNTGFGACNGACLLVANALADILPGAEVVSLVRVDIDSLENIPAQPMEAEHYGVRWQGWIYDGLGGFPDGDTWAEFFALPLEFDLVMVDRYVPHDLIPAGDELRAKTSAYLRKALGPIDFSLSTKIP